MSDVGRLFIHELVHGATGGAGKAYRHSEMLKAAIKVATVHPTWYAGLTVRDEDTIADNKESKKVSDFNSNTFNSIVGSECPTP